MRRRRGQRGCLRDAATMCPAVLDVPGSPLQCQLEPGHLEHGLKHQNDCTRWGRPTGGAS